MMSDGKKDLIKLFGLEGQIEPRNPLFCTQKDIDEKSPYECSAEVKQLIDMVNGFAIAQDIDGMLKCLQAISMRVTSMQEAALDIKNIIDKIRKDKDSA